MPHFWEQFSTELVGGRGPPLLSFVSAMNSPPPEPPAHLVAAVDRMPEEAAELLGILSCFPGPDMPTSIVSLVWVDIEEAAGSDETSEQLAAQTADLLHSLAREGLINRFPEAGPERWFLSPEQQDSMGQWAELRLAQARRTEKELWLEATGEELPDSELSTGQTPEEFLSSEDIIRMAQELHHRVRGAGDRHGEAVTSNNLGHVLCDAGRFAEAIGLLETAERLYAETGDHTWSARAKEKLEETRRLSGS